MKLKMILKRYINRLPEQIKNPLCDAYIDIKYPEMREIKKSFGAKNPESTFYVIRPLSNSVEGLMSLLYNVLLHISYAEQKGYIPVVDFLNYKTQYNVDNENVWEIFFNQPTQFSLEEAYQSRNVIISGMAARRKAYQYLQHRSCDEDNIRETQRFLKKYIKCSTVVKSTLENEEKIIHPENCVGLYLRGTDYTSLRPSGEPRQPSVNEALEKVKLYQNKYKTETVFLVTEDESIYNEVKAKLGKNLRIVSFDAFIKKYDSNDFLAKDGSLDQISKDKHVRGINYLTKILLLSKCKCIVGGRTSGSWAACAFADQDTELEIFRLGEY